MSCCRRLLDRLRLGPDLCVGIQNHRACHPLAHSHSQRVPQYHPLLSVITHSHTDDLTHDLRHRCLQPYTEVLNTCLSGLRSIDPLAPRSPSVSAHAMCNAANENYQMTLTAPSGVFTSVAFASYGTGTTGSCPSYTAGSCSSINSSLIVAQGKSLLLRYSSTSHFPRPYSLPHLLLSFLAFPLSPTSTVPHSFPLSVLFASYQRA